MKAGRRQFIAGLLATGLVPKPTWADAGSPSFLSAAALPDGTYVLCGIDADLTITFQLPLPARGHAAAAHPLKPEAVAFARRPGTFAIVIDCTTGVQKAIMNAPAGRHFYGHGAFSADGTLLYTTENDYEAGRGRIGVWDVASGYVRIDEWVSGGIGPHDIKRLPNSHVLVVANGGIDTHPESGRTKLNIPTMKPNLSYVQDGTVIESVELPPEMHKNSIRHLAVSQGGQVAFGMQWQGDGIPQSLVGHHALGRVITLMQASPDQIRDMQGYVGSIAFAHDGATIVVTSPRGNTVQRFDAASAQILGSRSVIDVCGVAATVNGLMLTAGTGQLASLTAAGKLFSRSEAVQWDNHLIPILPNAAIQT
ncbi:hypothetical protein RB2150_00040 [Rhodobacterales bacterium HTCC2150]|nr:hypothetical protein RB2150_00040 [Rhodobacterales bacterium HTCC2150] [Rhodobacteraceae bacterium HTCC2150]